MVHAAKDLTFRVDLDETLMELHASPDILNPSAVVDVFDSIFSKKIPIFCPFGVARE